jgi:hypothetical protein
MAMSDGRLMASLQVIMLLFQLHIRGLDEMDESDRSVRLLRNKRLDGTQLNFEDQLTNGVAGRYRFRTCGGHQVNLSYFDLNVGVCITDLRTAITTISVYRLTISFNRPNRSPGIVYIHFPTFHCSRRIFIPVIPINNNNFIHFSGLYSRQANAVDAMLGRLVV